MMRFGKAISFAEMALFKNCSEELIQEERLLFIRHLIQQQHEKLEILTFELPQSRILFNLALMGAPHRLQSFRTSGCRCEVGIPIIFFLPREGFGPFFADVDVIYCRAVGFFLENEQCFLECLLGFHKSKDSIRPKLVMERSFTSIWIQLSRSPSEHGASDPRFLCLPSTCPGCRS